MICRHDISNLKTDINDMIGQKIMVKGSLGRSKEFAKEGTIEKAYSNLFVVKYEENDRTASYTYTDLLTRTVEVDVFNGEEYPRETDKSLELMLREAPLREGALLFT